MKDISKSTLLFILLTMTSPFSFAEDNIEKQSVPVVGRGTELSPEELERSIGRYGEVDEIPEGFQFTEAEDKLWRTDHLANIDKPMSLFYEFVKSGTFEDGFTDSIYLKILELNKDGTKNAMLDFFTAEKKQVVSPENVTHITGNPIIGVFMQGDVYEMNRLTEGHWRHFQKQIKVSLRKNAVVEPTSFNFNGKEYKGSKVYFSPYLEDPHRRDFEKFAEKYYEFIFSDEIPGSLYQIKTMVPDKSKESAEPLIQEMLTLVDVK